MLNGNWLAKKMDCFYGDQDQTLYTNNYMLIVSNTSIFKEEQ
jgi:hypothetical protein